MTRHSALPAGTALLSASLLLGITAPLHAQELRVQETAEASADTGASDQTAASSTPDMAAPGRSTVPAPAFGPLPRIERRNDFSSQNMAVELRFGPYAPRIDDSTNGAIRDGFFGDKKRFQFGFEFDAQLWRAPYVGTLGIGLGWSYTRWSALNKPCTDPASSCASEPPDDVNVTETDPISQKSTFNIMPMYAVGVLRVDVLARELSIPLVGYGKFGFGYALWWINDGTGIADFNGEPAKDTSVGTHAALGAMFLLDVLEPSAGRELDSAAGINNSYVFFEWSVSDYNRMNVGSSTWVTGLAAEF
jgi:hypothetical protein